MTISLGIATFPQHAQSANELLKRADIALYQAKANGRNRVEEAALINVKPSFDELAVPPSGNADIDQEHQFAMDLLETITQAIRQGSSAQQVLPQFKRLKDHFFLHCINEERILGEHGYPANLLKKHHQKHQELIHLFEFLEQRLNFSNGTLDEEYIQILTRIIVGHMYSDDQSFFEHLRQSIV